MDGLSDFHGVSIDTLHFVLRVNGRDAPRVQQRCSAWCHTHLKSRLSALRAQTGAGNGMIEQLVLDVGDVRLSRLEAELEARIMQQLSERLQRWQMEARRASPLQINGASLVETERDEQIVQQLSEQWRRWQREARRVSPSRIGEACLAAWEDVMANDGWVTLGTRAGVRMYERETRTETGQMLRGREAARAGSVTALTTTASALVPAPDVVGLPALSAYLRTGVWHAPAAWMPPCTPDAWLCAQLMQPQPDALRVALASACLHPRGLLRLLATFSPPTCDALAAWLATGHSPETGGPLWLSTTRVEAGLAVILRALPWVRSWPVAAPVEAAQLATGVAAPDPVGLALWRVVLGATQPMPAMIPTRLGEALVQHAHALLSETPTEPVQAALQALAHGLGEPVATDDATGSWRARLFEVTGAGHRRSTVAGQNTSALPTAQAASDAARYGEAAAPKPRVRTQAPRDMSRSLVQALPLPVANAGLVLLWPTLPRLFRTLTLTDDTGQFKDNAARQQALACLDWLAWSEPVCAEWRTPLTRMLCGVSDAGPLEPEPLTAQLREMLDGWLAGALGSLPRLSRCSIGELRALFLQRPGTLHEIDGALMLSVSREAIDILLNEVPWPLTQVALPWLSSPLSVDWIA
ncbi:contractile injection system tape measure protein [Mycetohabitans rhizoxinica]|uniref:contractile injection system tape measure protein n=1 Tax=Mycetohabitans rhizoxinica TaxID=412963 RepID=UPI0030CB2C72